MLKFLIKLFPFRAIKLFLRLLASLASAIVIVSGYLFFISNNERDREDESVIKKSEADDHEYDSTDETD